MFDGAFLPLFRDGMDLTPLHEVLAVRKQFHHRQRAFILPPCLLAE